MEVITYSLRDRSDDSDRFYRDIATFTDTVISRAETLFPLVESFRSFVRQTGREPLRSAEEYLFELVTLGTLWTEYCADAHDLPDAPGRVLVRLAWMRRHCPALKPAVDFARGILSTLFLSPKSRDWSPRPTLRHMEKLLYWMAATGDYEQAVKRLATWRDYWAVRDPDRVRDDIGQVLAFSRWFEAASEDALGRYTPNVNTFLKESQPSHKWKEDVVFSARRRAEYHLNMVGAEIMNRAFRDAFIRTKEKAVVLPACLRYHSKPECKARSNGLSCECMDCTPRCRVHQLKMMGKKYGFAVYLVPHESSVFSGEDGRGLIGEGTGVVGIACVSNLVASGWKAKALGLPPQCVLLDHCGCRKHWHDKGFSTDLNVAQLRKILGIESGAGKSL